jgi:hypothetical protein
VSLASAVAKRSIPIEVTRRDEGVYGSDGRFSEGETETETVRMAVQPNSRSTALMRALTGDKTTGEVKVFVTDASLASVGWSELRVAPPEDSSGPPGDRFSWNGRQWEIVELKDWSASSAAGFRHYVAQERGAAS